MVLTEFVFIVNSLAMGISDHIYQGKLVILINCNKPPVGRTHWCEMCTFTLFANVFCTMTVLADKLGGQTSSNMFLFVIFITIWLVCLCNDVHLVIHRPSRNLSEKKRRDKLNIYISELAAMVPSCASSQRKLDKTTVLKMTVAYMKVHNGKISI